MALYGLYLNMMRGRTEDVRLMAVADAPERLVAWQAEERLPDGGERIDGWFFTYREGPLRWYNPPASLVPDGASYFGEGVRTIPTLTEYLRSQEFLWRQEIEGKLLPGSTTG